MLYIALALYIIRHGAAIAVRSSPRCALPSAALRRVKARCARVGMRYICLTLYIILPGAIAVRSSPRCAY